MLYCLYNGEYGEHDLSHIPGIGGTLRKQKECYEKHKGTIVGDFTCICVEYDWGRHTQRWHCKCNLCGKEIYVYNAGDWARGKGKKTTCDCRDEAKKREKELLEAERLKRSEERKAIARQRAIEKANRPKRKRPSYSEEQYKGVKIGHVTALHYVGSTLYHFKCDCGREFDALSTKFFKYRSITTCNSHKCPYYVIKRNYSRIATGYKFEAAVREVLSNAGYECNPIGKTGDFGVDIIASKDGEKPIAVQCKFVSDYTSINCVQEVYAGGRYYGLERFAVISNKEFTPATISMAKRLGVYLCDNAAEFSPPADMEEYCEKLMPVYKETKTGRKYEINGIAKTVNDWCYEYGVSANAVREFMKHGYSIDTAIKRAKDHKRKKQQQYTIDGFTGNLSEIAERYGMIPETLRYRIKFMGMSIEDAVHTPLQNHNGLLNKSGN